MAENTNEINNTDIGGSQGVPPNSIVPIRYAENKEAKTLISKIDQENRLKHVGEVKNIYQGSDNPISISKTDYDKYSKYNKVGSIIGYTGNPLWKEAEYETMANNQSGWEQAGYAVVQTAASIVGDTIGGVGTIFDFQGWYNKWMGNEGAFERNWLEKAGYGLSESAADSFEILQTRKSKEGFEWSSNYFFSRLPSVVSTLSLLLPAYGMAKGSTLIAKGLSTAVKSTKYGKVLSNAAKLENAMVNGAETINNSKLLFKNANKTAKMYQRSEAIVAGISQRIMDSSRSAGQTYEEQYNYYKDFLKVDAITDPIEREKKDKEAKNRANADATNAYRISHLNLAFDIFQYNTLFKAQSIFNSKINAKLNSALLKKGYVGEEAKKKLDDIIGVQSLTKDVLSTISSEAGDEILMDWWQQQAKDNGISKVDPSHKSMSFGDYLTSKKAFDAGLWGAVGGLVFLGAGKIMEHKSNKKDNANTEQLLNNVVAGLDNSKVLFKDLMKHSAEGNIMDYTITRGQLINDMIRNGVETGTIAYTTEFLDNLSNVDVNSEQGKQTLDDELFDANSVNEAKSLKEDLISALNIYQEEYGRDYSANFKKLPKEEQQEMSNVLSNLRAHYRTQALLLDKQKQAYIKANPDVIGTDKLAEEFDIKLNDFANKNGINGQRLKDDFRIKSTLQYHIDRLEEAIKNNNSRIEKYKESNVPNSEIEELENLNVKLEKDKEEYIRNFTEYNDSNSAKFENNFKELDNINSKITSIESNKNNIIKEHNSKVQDFNDIKQQIKDVEDSMSKLEKDIESSSIQDKEGITKTSKSIAESTVNSKRNRLKDLNIELDNLKAKLDIEDNNLKVANEEFNTTIKNLNIEQSKLETLKNEFNSLVDEYKTNNIKSSELDNINNNISFYNNQYDKFNDASKVENSINSYIKKRQSVHETSAKVAINNLLKANNKTDYDNLYKVELDKAQKGNYVQEFINKLNEPDIQSKIKFNTLSTSDKLTTYKNNVNKLEADNESINKQISDIESERNTLNTKQDKTEDDINRLKSIGTEIATLKGTIEKNNNEIKSINDLINKLSVKSETKTAKKKKDKASKDNVETLSESISQKFINIKSKFNISDEEFNNLISITTDVSKYFDNAVIDDIISNIEKDGNVEHIYLLLGILTGNIVISQMNAKGGTTMLVNYGNYIDVVKGDIEAKLKNLIKEILISYSKNETYNKSLNILNTRLDANGNSILSNDELLNAANNIKVKYVKDVDGADVLLIDNFVGKVFNNSITNKPKTDDDTNNNKVTDKQQLINDVTSIYDNVVIDVPELANHRKNVLGFMIAIKQGVVKPNHIFKNELGIASLLLDGQKDSILFVIENIKKLEDYNINILNDIFKDYNLDNKKFSNVKYKEDKKVDVKDARLKAASEVYYAYLISKSVNYISNIYGEDSIFNLQTIIHSMFNICKNADSNISDIEIKQIISNDFVNIVNEIKNNNNPYIDKNTHISEALLREFDSNKTKINDVVESLITKYAEKPEYKRNGFRYELDNYDETVVPLLYNKDNNFEFRYENGEVNLYVNDKKLSVVNKPVDFLGASIKDSFINEFIKDDTIRLLSEFLLSKTGDRTNESIISSIIFDYQHVSNPKDYNENNRLLFNRMFNSASKDLINLLSEYTDVSIDTTDFFNTSKAINVYQTIAKLFSPITNANLSRKSMKGEIVDSNKYKQLLKDEFNNYYNFLNIQINQYNEIVNKGSVKPILNDIIKIPVMQNIVDGEITSDTISNIFGDELKNGDVEIVSNLTIGLSAFHKTTTILDANGNTVDVDNSSSIKSDHNPIMILLTTPNGTKQAFHLNAASPKDLTISERDKIVNFVKEEIINFISTSDNNERRDIINNLHKLIITDKAASKTGYFSMYSNRDGFTIKYPVYREIKGITKRIDKLIKINRYNNKLTLDVYEDGISTSDIELDSYLSIFDYITDDDLLYLPLNTQMFTSGVGLNLTMMLSKNEIDNGDLIKGKKFISPFDRAYKGITDEMITNSKSYLEYIINNNHLKTTIGKQEINGKTTHYDMLNKTTNKVIKPALYFDISTTNTKPIVEVNPIVPVNSLENIKPVESLHETISKRLNIALFGNEKQGNLTNIRLTKNNSNYQSLINIMYKNKSLFDYIKGLKLTYITDESDTKGGVIDFSNNEIIINFNSVTRLNKPITDEHIQYLMETVLHELVHAAIELNPNKNDILNRLDKVYEVIKNTKYDNIFTANEQDSIKSLIEYIESTPNSKDELITYMFNDRHYRTALAKIKADKSLIDEILDVIKQLFNINDSDIKANAVLGSILTDIVEYKSKPDNNIQTTKSKNRVKRDSSVVFKNDNKYNYISDKDIIERINLCKK